MKRLIRPAFPILLCGVLLGGCRGDVELPGTTQGSTSTRITGTVTATANGVQFVTVRPGATASLTSFLLGAAHAAVTGLTPVAGATVELVRLSDGAVIATAITGGAGTYTFPEAPVLGPTLEYAVRVQDENLTVAMRALVSGASVDISPASEVVAEAVLDGEWSVSNFEIQEAAALNGLVASMDVDVSGMDFIDAVTAIRTAAGGILPDVVAGFASPGAVTSLRGNDYSVINYSAALRDPLVVPAEGAPGGVEIRSGQGSLIYGFATNSDAPTVGFLAEGAFLHDFSAVVDPSGQDQDAFPFLSVLTDLLHVPNDRGQLLVADRRRPSVSVAGVGALAGSGDYLVYPLDGRVLVEGDPSVFLMGLRYAARWRAAGEAQPPVLDLTLLDAPGGTGTVYNHVRLQQTLDGPGAGTNGVRLATEVGTMTFDSTPQSADFDNQPTDYGSFVANTVSDTVSLDLSDYSISAGNGNGIRNGFYFIPANSGLVQLRGAPNGDMLGWAATSTDGLRDGEILGGQMFSGGFNDPIVSAERSFSIAIRRAADLTAADLAGNYNLVEYGGYVANDVEAEPPRGFIETGIRYGTVTLDGINGISGGSLFRKVARIDAAAARGETGAVANASGESGAFTTATAGEAGETFSLTVDGTEVAVFTPGPGGTVTAEDIQGMIDVVAPTSLADDGILVEGSAIEGDLVFVRPTGEPFDIAVVNDFTGTAAAPARFEGADFAATTNIIDNGNEAVEAVATESSSSGAFAAATSTEPDQTYSMMVGGVEVFEFTSTAAGQVLTAADIQGGVIASQADLDAAGVDFTGSAESGDLVFTRADGSDFDIVIVNGFSDDALGSGGFAGDDFSAGVLHTIANGTEAQANASSPSGEFQTAVAGDVDETYSIKVGEVEVFRFTSTAAGQTVTAADIQGGVIDRQSELSAAGIDFSGSAETGDLLFRKADGTPFFIEVENSFSNPPGGFADVNFSTGSWLIEAGEPADPSISGLSGAFTTATAGGPDEEFTLEVGGITLFTRTSGAAGDTVDAADVQAGVDASIDALGGEGILVSGSIADEDLRFTKGDGTPFTIQVTNTFGGIEGAAGGFPGVDFQAGINTITGGTEAEEATGNASGPSGAFETGVAGGPEEIWSMTIGSEGGVEVFSFTSTAEGDTVTAADIQAGIDSSAGALEDAGYTVSGTATGGDLVFARDDGAPFDIVINSDLTGRVSAAGGFAGEDFATGERTIDNGSLAGAAPSLAASSGQEVLSFGSYSVSHDGVMTLTLDIGNETITGEGAVTGAGDFAAVVTGSIAPDGARAGRSILFLVRQPD